MKNNIPLLNYHPLGIYLPTPFKARSGILRRFLAWAVSIPLAGLSLTASAAIIAIQDFEPIPAVPTFLYTATGGSILTGSSGSGGGPWGSNGDRPSFSPYYSGGAQAYQVNSGTATLTFDAVNTGGFTGVQLGLRVAAFSAATSANGLDLEDYVEVQISPDNGAHYYPTVRVTGNNNAYWSYAGGTGNAATAYDGDATAAVFAPAGKGERTTDGYSTITITSLPAVSQLRVRVIMKNDHENERWVIDDLLITGTLAEPPQAGNNGPVCAGETLSLTASTIHSATYAWTGPNGFTANVQNPTIANVTPAASGVYSVTATVNGHTSPVGTTSVIVNSPPATSAISGSSVVAIGQAGQIYSVTPTLGSSYAWTVPGDAAITAGAGTAAIEVRFGSSGGNVAVSETTAAGCVGDPISFGVAVGPNHAPIAQNKTLTTTKNTPAACFHSKLLAGATDADHDSLSISSADPTSAQGGIVVLQAGNITYVPPTDFIGSDSYSFTISDGQGGTATATVSVTVTANNGGAPNVVIPPAYDSANRTFRVTFAGIPHRAYTVETASEPNGSWSYLKTATADAYGLLEVTDVLPLSVTARYYRTTSP